MPFERNNVVAIGADFKVTHTSVIEESTRDKIVLELQITNNDIDFMIHLRDQEIEDLHRQKLKNIEMMELITCQNQ